MMKPIKFDNILHLLRKEIPQIEVSQIGTLFFVKNDLYFDIDFKLHIHRDSHPLTNYFLSSINSEIYI